MLKILFIEKALPEQILIQSRLPDYCIIITLPDIGAALDLLKDTETDLILLGPSAGGFEDRVFETLKKLKISCRLVVLSRVLPDSVCDSSGSGIERILIPDCFDLLQDIIDSIVKDRLKKITTSPSYRLNRMMSILVGSSPQIVEVKDRIFKYGTAPGPVLITGESGTGKDIIARLLHEFSGRSSGPFHAVNAGAIPAELSATELFGSIPGAYTGAVRRSGFFEYADGGTLFLDEIGELDMPVQAELLRVLESRSLRRVGSNEHKFVDVRLLTATNADLLTAVRTGRFRRDLLYRINMFCIHIPPLRNHKEDIPDLLMHFSEQLRLERPNKHWEFSDEFLDRLFEYDWPGNVRELRNVFRRAVYSSDNEILTADSICPTVF